jgi:hypothetical protein
MEEKAIFSQIAFGSVLFFVSRVIQGLIDPDTP